VLSQPDSISVRIRFCLSGLETFLRSFKKSEERTKEYTNTDASRPLIEPQTMEAAGLSIELSRGGSINTPGINNA
jgi:hypothetical protein